MIGRMEVKGSGERKKMTEKKGLRDEREAVWKDERKAGDGKEEGKEGGKERREKGRQEREEGRQEGQGEERGRKGRK